MKKSRSSPARTMRLPPAPRGQFSEVTVRVPGSTSNCGAGFDTLGLALQIYNEVTLTRAPRGLIEPAFGESIRALPLIWQAIDAFEQRTGGELGFGLFFAIEGDVPVARGLGSSVTVLAGALAALNEMTGAKLSRHDLTALVAGLEGHPDNAAAGILGGFCVARTDPATGAYRDTIRVTVPDDLRFVVCSPDLEMPTKESRGVLPPTLPFFDAVKSVNSAAYLTAAFATRDYARLRGAASDFLHEPYRLLRIPGGREAIAAGVAAGALTGWLSGSGSSVLCVAERKHALRIGRAMTRAFQAGKIGSRVFALRADHRGLRITARRR